MRAFRFLTSLASLLLILGAAAAFGSVSLSGALRSPVALLLGSDQRLTYLDLARHASLTT